MIKGLIRTTLYAGAAYGFYAIARQLFPSQIDSAVSTAKSYGNDAVKTITEQGKQLLAQGEKLASDTKSDIKSASSNVSSNANSSRRAV